LHHAITVVDMRFSGPEVRRHAATVDSVAEAVREARGAVHEVTMDQQAYGQLCQFLPGLLAPLFGLAVTALDKAAGALDGTAGDLRATAGQMEATDAASAGRVRAAGELPL
jgi:hypothetical protein